MNQLTEIKKYLSTEDNKVTVQDNYIEMLLKLHPKCKPTAIIEHINTIQLSCANPFKKQVYFTSYFSKKLGHSVGTTVFSYRFFEDQANKTKEFEGCECEIGVDEYFDPSNGEVKKTLKAIATAHRKNRKPVIFEAWYPEMVQKDFKGQPQSTWKSMPHLMLRKCAIAGALRSAFPETVGTFLIEEEVNKEYDESAEKIVELENDIETTAKKVEKEKAIVKNMEDRPDKEQSIEYIKKLCGEITKGMKKNEKVDWLAKTLNVYAFGQFKDFELIQLNDVIEKLKSIKKEPIVINQVITVDDIPFDDK